jgi:hypothetical protein
MDTRLYSEDTIRKYLLKNLCKGDKVLLKYYDEGKVREFRKRLSTRHKDANLKDILYVYVTDTIRDIIYKIIGELSEHMKPMGDLVISGGDAFNMQLPRADRVVTSDIDTKFAPRMKYDQKFFGKLQAIKLIMWDKLGQVCVRFNKAIKERIQNDRSKLKKFLGVSFTESGPWVTRRYTLMKKKKLSSGANVSKGNVLTDVELFALDLNVGWYDVTKGRVVQQRMGGILDIPFMRPGEFGFDVIFKKQTTGVTYVNRNSGAVIHDKRVAVASKAFLIHDVVIMQELNLRPEKKAKDRARLIKLAQTISKGMKFRATDTIFDIYFKVIKKLPSRTKTLVMNGKVDMRVAQQKDPYKYAKYTIQPDGEKLKRQLVYGVNTLVPLKINGFVKTNGRQRFDVRKKKWVKNDSLRYIGNEWNYKPSLNLNKLNFVNESVWNKLNTRNTLYGYNPVRDKWVPEGLLIRASLIPFVGMEGEFI